MADEDLLVWAIVVLEDAAEQPGSLVLYERNSGGTYEPRSDGGATLYYEGDETDYWDPSDMDSCLVAYNRLDPDESGRIDWFRVRFNYSFPDGSSGYVDSDEFAVCQGTYLGGGESMLLDSGFTAIFPLDTDLVDPSKVSVTSATLTVGSEEVSLNSYVDTDEGVVRAGLLFSEFPAGVSLAYNGSSYTIEIETTYSDTGVSWEDAGECMLTTQNLGNYVQSGYSSSLPESTRSNPTPAGFRTTVFLDEEIVGRPDTTQPYGDGQTLELTSVKLTKNGGDAETVLVDNVIFYPVESPYLTFEYHAPSDQPLEIDDYELEVELNYNAPNEDPPVADLVDSDSHSFSVVPETLFGDGEFTYSPSSYLGGSIPLLGGINSDQLTDIEFTIYQGWSDITSQVAPNSHQTPAAGSAKNWIGFELKASDGDTIPTFNASAEYYVMVSAKYKEETYYSPRIRIMMPSGPTGSYLGAGTVSMIEISLSEGFTAKFPLDLSIVPDASDDTISAVSVTLTRPGGVTQDLLGDPDSEYYVYSEGANTLFEFRYECPADPLPTGNYTLNVTLTYTSGTVTNLQSSNSASFTVAESPPDYDYWVIDPETWCDPPATGATTVVAKTELIVEYDPEYSYSATVTGGRIIWTVDGTQQSSVAISPLPAMTDNPDQERLESGLVGFTVALPTTGTDWSYKLEFDLDVAASDGSDTTHFPVTVSSSEFSVPLPPQHSFSPSVTVASAGAGTTLELTANGRVVIAYNTETGFTYSAELTALEISLDDGATFQTVDGTYWGYSAASGDVGTLSYDFWIGSGYTLPVEASSARLRFTAHITGEHGSDSYDTTVYPAGTTSITINP